MEKQARQKPAVLVFSGHDPSGGAGIQADIESIAASGCHCVSVLTTTTAQNTSKFEQLIPQSPDYFAAQIKLLISDITIHACKIGLIGSTDLLAVIVDTLQKFGNIPVVLDPILASGTGTDLIEGELQATIIRQLFPLVTVLTPNSQEARRLTGCTDDHRAASKLFEYGCKCILITGADNHTDKVINVLFQPDKEPLYYEWKRLPYSYHGSGCTLAANIAGHLALGSNIVEAIKQAQQYTWQTLKHGYQLGKGQYHPDRFFHLDKD